MGASSEEKNKILKAFARLFRAQSKLVLVDYSEYAKRVADAYDARPAFEAKYVPSWKALASHCGSIFKQIQSKVDVQFVEEDPYASAKDMLKEVKEKKILRIYTGHSDHPVWSPRENHIFRAVHDWYSHVLGAGSGGHGFNLRGEYNSYNRHVKLAPEAARLALFTEVVGQASFKQVRGSFPPQKICKLWGFDYVALGKIDELEFANNFEDKQKLNKEYILEIRDRGKVNRAVEPKLAASLPHGDFSHTPNLKIKGYNK